MSKLLQPRQVNLVFKRAESIVKTVEQRTHSTGPDGIKFWKRISFFVGFPLIGLASVNSYMRYLEEKEHEDERPEFIHYPYMKIMNKRFPWGDGKHSLFHNPKRNYIPGIGYEA